MKIKDAKWEPLNNEIGMKPKFRVVCFDCVFNAFIKLILDGPLVEGDFVVLLRLFLHRVFGGEFDMPLREVFCSPLPTIGERAFHNDMHYKCAKSYGCDAVKTFGVPIDEEYYEVLMQRRKGQARIQPREDWDKDEDLKKQLKNMGYL